MEEHAQFPYVLQGPVEETGGGGGSSVGGEHGQKRKYPSLDRLQKDAADATLLVW